MTPRARLGLYKFPLPNEYGYGIQLSPDVAFYTGGGIVSTYAVSITMFTDVQEVLV